MDRPNTATKSFRSPLRYPGGKQRAVLQIANFMPKNATEYREPFVGGGSVYFHARSIAFAKTYWINDKFKELVSFWRAVQNPETCKHMQIELEEMRCQFKSSDEIKDFFISARKEKVLSEYREALLFFFFNRVTFSGTTRAGGFSKLASQRRFTPSSIERLTPMPEALRDTEITNLGFEKVIQKPGKDVFIFLDPPYFTASRLYGPGGSLHEFDHELLADCLRRSHHKFLITYDDCKEIRSLYDFANIQSWSLQYGMNNCNVNHTSKIGSEIFISNY